MAMREDTLTVTVTISVPVGGLDVNELESRCQDGAREALEVTVRRMQEAYQRRASDRLERREWKVRYLVTGLGRVRLEMLKVRDRTTGKSHNLGQDLLNLAPRQRLTRSVERQGVSLRVRGLSYRQSAEVLEERGLSVSAMGLWRRVQARGKQRCRLEAAEQERIFQRKDTPKVTPPAYLYLEADEIHVGAQRSQTDSHRIKTGISYTGRERQKGYARSRYRLTEKGFYGGVESLEAFGKGWYTLLERRYGLSGAKAVLYLTDGDPGLVGLRATHFPQAIHAHDRAHVFRDLAAGAPSEACRKRWIGWLCEGKWDEAQRAMRRSLRRGSGASEPLSKVLRVPRQDFYGTRRFRLLYDPERTQRLPYATGGVEKNQEITIGRAMKKRGMAWTATGAHHLSKLIFAFQHSQTWESLWMEPPPLT
jgi:hypothetical protein